MTSHNSPTMPEETVQKIVAQIHNTSHRVVFEFAGAGSLALFWLHSISGSSRTMLEATDHYAASSTVGILGYEPQQFVTPKTARDMALRAYQRGLRLSNGLQPVIGIGCTGTITTDYPKRGDHHCQIAVCQHQRLTRYALTFTKGKRDRIQEETLVSRIVISGLADACDLSTHIELGLDHSEKLQTYIEKPADPLDQLLQANAETVTVNPDGRMVVDEPLAGTAILSGSFDPLHDGHRRLADVAAQTLQLPVIFELPIINADKAPIDYLDLCRRLGQFREPHKVILTRSPLFSQKSVILPNSVFVIGFDTAIRLLEHRYYGGDVSRMHGALQEIRAAGCRFLVAGRLWKDKFQGLLNLEIPTEYESLFQALSENQFRVDVASSELRPRNTPS